MKKSSKALKSQSISALICAPGPEFFFLLSGAGWQIKENQNRLAPGRLRPGKVFSLPKSDNGFCLICYFLCWGQVTNVTGGPEGLITALTSQAGNLSKNHFSWGIMQDCYLGQYLQILSSVSVTHYWALIIVTRTDSSLELGTEF